MTKQDFDRFIDTAFWAYASGATAAQMTTDDGTCNCDAVKLRIPRSAKKCAAFLARLGFRPSVYAGGVITFMSPFGGMAYKNQKAVEEIARVFREAQIPGMTATVEYRMD